MDINKLVRLKQRLEHSITEFSHDIFKRKDFVKLNYLNFKIEAKNMDGKMLKTEISLENLDLSEEE